MIALTFTTLGIALLTLCAFLGVTIAGMLFLLQLRLRSLEKRNTPFWAVLQKHLSELLHHPHPESAELDGYLEKLERLEITEEETRELENLLKEKHDDPGESDKERELAEILLFIMPRVIQEREGAQDLISITRQLG